MLREWSDRAEPRRARGVRFYATAAVIGGIAFWSIAVALLSLLG